MTELGSVTDGRPGPARQKRESEKKRDFGFRRTGPGPALPDSRISTHRARRGGCRAGSVTEGRPALWSPARVERARPLVPSTGGAWPGGGALRCCRREKRRRRTEERREEEKRDQEKKRRHPTRADCVRPSRLPTSYGE